MAKGSVCPDDDIVGKPYTLTLISATFGSTAQSNPPSTPPQTPSQANTASPNQGYTIKILLSERCFCQSSQPIFQAAALHELELAVSAKNLNIGVFQLTMDFGIINKNIYLVG